MAPGRWRRLCRNKLFIQNTQTDFRWRSTKGTTFSALFLDFFPPCVATGFFSLYLHSFTHVALRGSHGGKHTALFPPCAGDLFIFFLPCAYTRKIREDFHFTHPLTLCSCKLKPPHTLELFSTTLSPFPLTISLRASLLSSCFRTIHNRATTLHGDKSETRRNMPSLPVTRSRLWRTRTEPAAVHSRRRLTRAERPNGGRGTERTRTIEQSGERERNEKMSRRREQVCR